MEKTLLKPRNGPTFQVAITLSAFLLLTVTYLTNLSFTLSSTAANLHEIGKPQHFESDIGSNFIQPYHDTAAPLTYPIANETCRTATSIPPLFTDTLDRLPVALRDYAEFHAFGTKCLERGRACKTSFKFLIWKGELGRVGGFGDRWKSIQYILTMAIATRRLFYIEWPNQAQTPYDLSGALHPTYIDWRFRHDLSNKSDITVRFERDPEGIELGRPLSFPNPMPEGLKTQRRLESNSSDFVNVLKQYEVVYIDNTFVHAEDIARLARNRHHQRRFKGLSNLDHIPLQRALTRFMFRPSPAVAYLARKRSFPLGVPYIAIHVRTGIDVTETQDHRFQHVSKEENHLTLIETMLTCANRHANEMVGKPRVFVSSDSKALKKAFIRYAQKNNIILNTNLNFAWHLDRTKSDLFEDYAQHCMAFLDIFADAYAVSEAVSVVYLPSNFPESAIGFGNVKAWHKLENIRSTLHEHECFPSNLTTIST